MKIRDYINVEASQEHTVFLKSARNGKITPQMKYDAFVKNVLPAINPAIREYVDAQKPKMEACETVEQLTALQIPVMTPELKELAISLVEKQKHLDIVEQTYLLLDVWRVISGQIGDLIARMAMHYGTALQSGAKIIRPGTGKIIIP